jgi:hypothetical protein
MAGSRTLKLSILADVDNLKKNLDTGSKEVEGFGGKLEKFSAKAKAAFAAAAAAAAAYAVKLAVDGVKAAIDDEAAQQRLETALKNVTSATDKQIASVEKQITKLSLAFGVADDKLRPAFQALATATGDVDKSQKLLNLALDIAATKNIDVETAAIALAKAYDGNAGSLGRLNVGLTSAEIKTLGFDKAVTTLTDNFKGGAATQADTYAGKIARVQVAFNEAEEAVGKALLPILENLLKFFSDKAIPAFEKLKTTAIDPVIKAFKDNEEALRDLWNFTKDYIIPIFNGALLIAVKGVGTAVSGVINIIGTVVGKIQGLVNDAIDAINKVIKAYNAIPILPNVPTIPNIGGGSQPNTVPSSGLPFGGVGGGGSTGAVPSTPSTPNRPSTPSTPSTGGGGSGGGGLLLLSVPSGKAIPSNFDVGAVRAGEAKSEVIINVNAPSVIDEEGFTRAVVLALNNSTNRGTTGAGDLRSNAQIL